MVIKDYGAIQKLLSDSNVDVNAQDGLGWTTLMRAVSRGDLESLTILLAAGAKPDLGNGLGIDPFSLARRDDNQAFIEILERALSAKKQDK